VYQGQGDSLVPPYTRGIVYLSPFVVRMYTMSHGVQAVYVRSATRHWNEIGQELPGRGTMFSKMWYGWGSNDLSYTRPATGQV